MNNTYYYKLKLPSGDDIIDVTDLNDNFKQIDRMFYDVSKDLEPIEASDTLDIISASGNPSFYHGTPTALCLLSSVKTTWGEAEFGESHGTYSPQAGKTIELYITLRVKDGAVYWDEYYDSADAPEERIYIGEAVCVQQNADTVCSFSFTNDSYGEMKYLSLREAIIDLRAKVELLRKGNTNG